MRKAEKITDLVGQTPMVRLTALEPEGGAEIWAKLEYLNPGGSVKDRAALGIVLDAERRGVLREGSTIVEATAGNTGVVLALIGVNLARPVGRRSREREHLRATDRCDDRDEHSTPGTTTAFACRRCKVRWNPPGQGTAGFFNCSDSGSRSGCGT